MPRCRMPHTVLGIYGSLRRNSLNRALLRALADVAPNGLALTVYGDHGHGLADLPLFCPDAAETPHMVAALVDAVRAADAVIFATPEYNFSVPGCLKNAIDWLSRGHDAPLKHKVVGVVGSSSGMSGSLRAQLHLRQIMVYFDAPTMAQPEVLVTRAHEKFDQAGVLVDEPTRDHLRLFAVAFQRFMGVHLPPG